MKLKYLVPAFAFTVTLALTARATYHVASPIAVTRPRNCKAVETQCKRTCGFPANVSAVICTIDCMKKAGCL